MPRSAIVDLSQPLRTGQPIFPGDAEVVITPRGTHDTTGFASNDIRMGSHDGTHMDAGYHFFAAGMRLDEYPVDRFVGEGVVIDLRGAPADSPVDVDTFAAALEAAGGVGAGDFAILWFGWDEHYGGELMWKNPYLAPGAAALLVEAGVTLIGTDTTNVDSSTDLSTLPIHNLILGRDILIVESLCNLERVGAGRATFAFLPLPIAGADGAPTRAVAWWEK